MRIRSVLSVGLTSVYESSSADGWCVTTDRSARGISSPDGTIGEIRLIRMKHSSAVKLPRAFYEQSTVEVATQLLGKFLVRTHPDGERVGRIVETEAYVGPQDLACHAAKGRTKRTEVMFGPAGHAYVYFIYGFYNMLNLVTEAKDYPAAVLIPAVEPLAGLQLMQQRPHSESVRNRAS